MSDQWLTGPQVMAHFSVCDTTLFRWLRDPEMDFPRPMIIRRRRYWRESDIERWAKNRSNLLPQALPQEMKAG